MLFKIVESIEGTVVDSQTKQYLILAEIPGHEGGTGLLECDDARHHISVREQHALRLTGRAGRVAAKYTDVVPAISGSTTQN